MDENKNTAALAILDAPATVPATAGNMAPTAADTTVPGTLTPAATETVQAVPSPSSGGGTDLMYKPMFSVRTEKFVYILCVLFGLGAIVLSVVAADMNWPKVVGDTCGVMGGLVGSVASAFGVSYTTMRSL